MTCSVSSRYRGIITKFSLVLLSINSPQNLINLQVDVRGTVVEFKVNILSM